MTQAKSRQWWIVGGAATILVAAFLVMSRPLTWQAVAARSKQATYDVKGESLRGLFHAEELRAYGISEAQAISAVNEVIAPTVANLEPVNGTDEFLEVDAQTALRFSVRNSESKKTAKVLLGIINTGSQFNVMLSDLVASAMQAVLATGAEAPGKMPPELIEMFQELSRRGITGYWHIDTNEIEIWPTE